MKLMIRYPALSDPKRKALPYLFLAAAVCAAYANVYGNAFLFDDQVLILQNEYLRYWRDLPLLFTTPIMAGAHSGSDFYRPLQTFLYFLIYQFSETSTFGYHLLNVALHAANAGLLYALGRKLGFKPSAVFVAALLWALHPIQTEAVTYMSATADGLYVFFILLGLVILVPAFAPRAIIAATVCGVLALLSKESAVVFPLLAVSCLFLSRRERLALKTYACLWPLGLIVAVYLFVRFAVMPFNTQEFVNLRPELQAYGQHASLRFYTFLATLPAYAELLFYPHALHIERGFPVAYSLWESNALLGLAMTIASLVVIACERKSKTPALSWGLIWFACSYAPQSGILVPVNALFLEHWMYLPTAGLFLGSAQFIATRVTRDHPAKILGGTACALALLLAVLTYRQNFVWRDPVPFYQNILDQGEVSVRARNNLGLAYLDKGEYAKAMEQFRQALKIREAAETHQNIASLYSRLPEGGPKMIPQEIEELQKALSIDPDYYQACKDLAFLYGYSGDPEKAAEYQRRTEAIAQKYSRYQ